MLEGAAGLFGAGATNVPPPVDLRGLHAKIGELALENDFLQGALIKASMAQAQSRTIATQSPEMIDRTHDLPIVRQAKVLNISRGCVYDKPRAVSAEDLALMRRIDEPHLEYLRAIASQSPEFAGRRMLRDFLRREGVEVGRRHVGALMKRMGIEALHRKPNTSKPTPGNNIYPYLLRGLKVERSNTRRCAFTPTTASASRGLPSAVI